MLMASVVLVLGVMMGCGGGSSDVGGISDVGDENQIPEKTILVSKIVGITGGELNHEEIDIIIPAGTLQEDRNITIFNVNDDGSIYYEIDGLPEELAESIKVILPIGESTPDSGETLLWYTQKDGCYSTTVHEQVDCVSLLEGEIRENEFLVSLPKNIPSSSTNVQKIAGANYAISGVPSTIPRTVAINTDYTTYMSDGLLFKLFIKKDITQSDSVNAYMDEILSDVYLALILNDFTTLDVIPKPYPVIVSDTSDFPSLNIAEGFTSANALDYDKTHMVIVKDTYLNAFSVEGKPELGTLLTHEFFHVAQFTTMMNGSSDLLGWLMEASSTYAEHMAIQGLVSHTVPLEHKYKNFLIYGIGADFDNQDIWHPTEDDATENRDEIGYGMGVFFYYLKLDSNTSSFVFDIWTESIAAGKDPLVAIENSISSNLNSTLSEEWLSFNKYYFSNDAVSLGWPRMSSNLKYDVGSDSDYSKSFTMPKYSALYVEFSNSADEAREVELEFNGLESTHLLMINKDGIVVRNYTADDEGKLTFPALAEGYKLVFVTSDEDDSLQFSIKKVPIQSVTVSKPSEDACVAGGGTTVGTPYSACYATWEEAMNICTIPSNDMWAAVEDYVVKDALNYWSSTVKDDNEEMAWTAKLLDEIYYSTFDKSWGNYVMCID